MLTPLADRCFKGAVPRSYVAVTAGSPDFATKVCLRRIFPDREWKEVPRSHALFHSVFDLPESLNLQCPNVRLGTLSQFNGVTWERPDAQEMHVRAWYDDKGRMCSIAMHNTDNCDGWEREGENEYYFREFSEKKAYPLMINLLFWVLTH